MGFKAGVLILTKEEDLGLEAWIWALRLKFGPLAWNLGYDKCQEAGVWALGWNLGLEEGNLGLKAGIWAYRLEFGP